MEDRLINLPENWEGGSIYYNDIFLLVVGKFGNGKSSVANNILGRSAFISAATMESKTHASKMKSTILKDGRHVHVIDTPGLVDFSLSSEFVGREILKGIDLAKDGLHAVLMVFAMHQPFTREEEVAIRFIKTFFGDRIFDYMIVVLTGWDVIEKEQTFSDWFKFRCPEPLKNLIFLCQERVVVFDNETEDEVKRERQVKRLISYSDFVVAINGGKLFTRKMIAKSKEGASHQQQMKKKKNDIPECSTKHLSKQQEEHNKSSGDEFEDKSEMVYHDLYQKIEKLENNLREEKDSRLQLEKVSLEAKEIAEATRLRSDEKIQELRLRSDEKFREFRSELDAHCDCVIL